MLKYLDRKNINRVRRFMIFTLLFLILLENFSCTNNKTLPIYTSENAQSSEKVGFKKLLNSPSDYKGKVLEVIGVFHTDFEESAIYSSSFNINKKQSIWITFNSDYYPLIDNKTEVNLLSSYQTIEKINKKKIRIRGKFNPNSKGHLSMYSGTIENVFYVEVLN